MKENNNNHIKEERITELETLARIDLYDIENLGYYGLDKNLSYEEKNRALEQDRMALTREPTREMKGKALTDKVEQYYNKSKIRKMKIDEP